MKTVIKAKTGQCIDCPPSTKMGYLYASGRCQMHYWNWRRLQKKFAPESLVNPNCNQEDGNLTDWFNYHIAASPHICQNCNEPIADFLDFNIAISCQAHILPKSIFPSVKLHKLNHLYLCGRLDKNFCHNTFDSSWKKAAEMPVFQIALTKFLQFKTNIDINEYNKLRKTPFYEYL